MGIFGRLNRHIELMSSMFGKTGITGPDSQVIFLEDEIRRAMSRCTSCQNAEGCSKWLEEAETGSAPPEFCANASYIERLQQSA
ncbi:MAG: DUF6455 family protein [Rhizobiaceae bacterium]